MIDVLILGIGCASIGFFVGSFAVISAIAKRY